MRTIWCECCHVGLGEIRDAKLKKGMVYLCANCNEERVGLHRAIQASAENNLMRHKNKSWLEFGE